MNHRVGFCSHCVTFDALSGQKEKKIYKYYTYWFITRHAEDVSELINHLFMRSRGFVDAEFGLRCCKLHRIHFSTNLLSARRRQRRCSETDRDLSLLAAGVNVIMRTKYKSSSGAELVAAASPLCDAALPLPFACTVCEIYIYILFLLFPNSKCKPLVRLLPD